jgi:hypothetical protein
MDRQTERDTQRQIHDAEEESEEEGCGIEKNADGPK